MAKNDSPINRVVSAIKDRFSRLGNQPTVASGRTGTSIYAGMINEEFNPELTFPHSIEVYDRMRKGDGTVSGLLEAIKQPIISAKWGIRPASEDEKDVEIANFITYALFSRLNFKGFLEEALTYNDFGFKYFEKVFVRDKEDPKYPDFIFWKAFASRLQSAHYKWTIDGKDWKDGHPAGVTQQLVGATDEIGVGGDTHPTIPWEKLILFTRKREGDNFEGISCLRSAYKHWYYLDMLYKVASVSAERYGVGFPWAKLKAGAGKATESKVDEMLANVRSQEQSYVRINSDVEEWGIMTPNGDAKAGAIQNLIDHHAKKLYESVLAGFLNLTSGDGGSNAMSRDQSSFFLRGLHSQAEYIREIVQDHIEELVRINFQQVEKFPTLTVTNIGTVSIDEIVNAIVSAKNGGLLTSSMNDENAVREILNLQPLPEKDEQDIELDRLENELDLLQMEMIMAPDDEEEEPEAEEDSADDEPKSPAEDEEPKEEEPVTEKELTEFFGSEVGRATWLFVAEGDELTQEHKDRIAEALRKKSNDTIENDIAKDTQSNILKGNKAQILAKLESVRAVLKSFREKSQGMDAKAKRAFNKQMKDTIAQLKKERDQLIQDRINVNTRIKDRKKEVSANRKERKLQEKIKKAIAKEEEKRKKEKEKAQKKKEKYDQKKASINQKIKDLQGNKDATSDPDKKQSIQDQIDKQYDKLENLKLAESMPMPSEREAIFLENIDEYENYLESEFSNTLEPLIAKYENLYRKGIVAIYEASETEMIDGVKSLKYDPKMLKKGEDFIDKLTKKLESDLIGGSIEEEIFEWTKRYASKAVLRNNELSLAEDEEEEEWEYEEVYIDVPRFTSFRKGWISNILGMLFNEPRRMKENMVMNYGTQVSLTLAVKQANETSFNRNIYKLSTLTHPRAAYQGIIFDNANKQGYSHYKVVVPPSKLDSLDRFGRTAGMIFFIGTAAVINSTINKQTEGQNPDAVKGMGIGHGSFEYYYPIDGGDLAEEEEMAQLQKQAFFDQGLEIAEE